MQRVPALVCLIVSLLYLAALAPANALAQEQAASAPVGPHIAVLLPTKSGPFMRAADAVRRGIWEAQRVQNEPGLPIVLYATTDDPVDATKAYQNAIGM